MKKRIYGYFDGHYEDSGLPMEERTKIEEEEHKKSEQLSSWDDAARLLFGDAWNVHNPFKDVTKTA